MIEFFKDLFTRTADHYLPWLGHYPNNYTAFLEDGSYMVIAECAGVPHELSTSLERNGQAKFLNTLWRQIADDTLTLGLTLVRFEIEDDSPEPEYTSKFARSFHDAYRTHILNELFENRWYVSLIVSPLLPGGNSKEYGREMARFRARFRERKHPDAERDAERLTLLNETWATVERTLSEYNIRRLGIREEPGDWLLDGYDSPEDEPRLYSEIAEALKLILYARYGKVGLVDGPLRSTVYSERAVFERRTIRLIHPDRIRYGRIVGLREYMSTTRPAMFDKLLPLRMPLVISQSFGFLPRQLAIKRLVRKQNQMIGSLDRAYSQIADIDFAVSEVAGGEVARGKHHWSVAFYANDRDTLDRRAGEMFSALADANAVVTEETKGNEAAWFAQSPGAIDWRVRPGVISTRNLAKMADFGTFPVGHTKGIWGDKIRRLRTVGHTRYDLIPHAGGEKGEVGMFANLGLTGGGKTALASTILLSMDSCIGKDGVIWVFSKDCDHKIWINAVNGSFLEIKGGVPSGLMPLKRLKNTPEDIDFLARWIKAFVQQDQRGPTPPDDDEKLMFGLQRIMLKPPQIRTFDGLRQYLGGWGNPLGLGARLEPWCKPNGQYWWAFDGDEDRVDTSTRVIGNDFTSLFKIPMVLNPAAQYLLYLMGQMTDGRRGITYMSEAASYLPTPVFSDMSDDVIRRGRKNNWIFGLDTQQPEDFTEVNELYGITLLEQSLTKYCFRDPRANEDIYCGRLKFTRGEFLAISERMLPGAHRFLLKRDEGSAIIDFDLTPILKYVAVLSGYKTTIDYSDELRARDPDGWVEQFMDTYHTVLRGLKERAEAEGEYQEAAE